MTRRIGLVVGDTAGHVLPAIAIADAYRSAFADVDVTFLAGEADWASRLIPDAARSLILVPSTPLMRVGPIGRLTGAMRVIPTFTLARRLLRQRGIRLVIGTGGSASGGVVLAARSLGLSTAIVEPNAEPGLANRLLSRIAGRAYVMFDETARHFPAGRTLKTGLPLLTSRARLLHDRTPPAANRAARLFVTGGSRGDAFLATAAPSLAARLAAIGVPVEVRHQAPSLDPQALERQYRQLGVAAQALRFVDDVSEHFDWADVIVARAGAGTLAEVALGGLPSLLVPLADAAADHQAKNAAAFASRGAALWVREFEWDVAALAPRLADLLQQPSKWSAMSSAARAQAAPDAAAEIVRDCEHVMHERWSSI
jgi:UDP-N-acetylglucosamine--N-acetylmuramyl-(pentapeptide) pyrophosphoryl-undecaprenol N-acetylglucosamine transferase